MSVTLKRMELTNFRSYAETSVDFPVSGLTTIVGPNGAGKSTLVSAALFFALYGKAPVGVSLKDLRRQGTDFATEPTSVTVHLDVDGREVVVTRSMRGKNSTSMAEITVDGEVVTDTKSGASTALVEQLVGPSEIFTTAFLVPQKALDSLVQARGADRRKLIERMAGVERLKAAVDEARSRAREAKAAHDALPMVGLDALRASEAETEESLASASEVLADAARLLADAERDAADKRTQIERVEAVARGALQRRVEWTRLATEAQQAASAVETAEKALTEAESRVLPVPDEPEAPADLAPLREELSTLREQKARLETQIAALPESVDTSAVDALTAELDGHADTDGDIVDVTSLVEKMSALTARKNHITGQLASLTDTCPTCEQPIADAGSIRAGLTAELESVDAELASVKTEHETAVARNASITSYRDSLTRLEAAQAQVDQQQVLLAQRDGLVADLATVQARGETLVAQVQETEAANTALVAAREAYLAAVAAVQARDSAQNTLDEALAVQKSANGALDAFGAEPVVDEDELEDAQRQEDWARTILDDAKARHAAAERGRQDAERAHADAVRNREAGEQQEAARTAAADTLRIATEVADGVAAFREARLAALVPALTESGSDHIATLSQGRFLAMELTDDFEPSLVDANGGTRAVSMLSGGEESLCALALRLAIGDEVADGADGSILVLDEILGAMDVDRRASIVEGLRALNRQVILVDHHGTAGDHTIDVGGLT